MSDLRFGMVGCGDISVRFFKMMQNIDGAEFVATRARHMESAKRRGKEYGVSAHYDDFRKMMDTENLDGEPAVFSGDVIFAGGIGRFDIPGGDYAALVDGIREKLFKLPPETVIYPGHGPVTTIARERKTNPFLI